MNMDIQPTECNPSDYVLSRYLDEERAEDFDLPKRPVVTVERPPPPRFALGAPTAATLPRTDSEFPA